MQSFGQFSFLSSPTTIYIKFNESDKRIEKSFIAHGQNKNEDLLLYKGKENVSGEVEIVVCPGKVLDHLGIKIELIGQIGKLEFNLYSIDN